MRKHMLQWVIIPVLLAIMASACKEIFEPSIAKHDVALLSPADNYISNKYSVMFWVEPIDDALFYRLQVVSPDFDTMDALILDTLINTNKFSFTLDPGEYQWRVSAENGSSKTAYSLPRSFIINFSSIEQQRVMLSAPANHLITNQANILFRWMSLFGADQYRLQIDTNNFADESAMLVNKLTSNIEMMEVLTRDQVYYWRVRAEADTVQSLWSVINSVRFDTTPPGRVSLKTPLKGERRSLPVVLQWNTTPSAKRYKLYALKSDSSSLFDTDFPLIVNGTGYTFNRGQPEDSIYWKVSAIDEAGNEGESSELRNFILR
ncbi:hypothetical protein [Desertivirga xinjiangensis]|uniref:hypothetical protein n=1 Tax=Desertivirga xinjiangensis TaxID=539206 RepID=UPI00210E7558|nr:hypothetical protein [Pedobacter xinjiangensis]